MPLAAMAWIAAYWDRIPLRYATSFDGDGRATVWTARTPLHVFGFPIFAEGLAALLVALALGIWYGSGRPSASSPMEKIPLAMAYLLSLVFTSIGLVPVMQLPIWLIVVMIPPLALGTIVYVVRAQGNVDKTAVKTPPECWTMGCFYNNPKDPSLFVPAKMGNGYTFNMANPWSRRLIPGLLLGIGLLTAFLIWSLE
jgi:uncharacterized membrane protein